jgi:hypothetical protein
VNLQALCKLCNCTKGDIDDSNLGKYGAEKRAGSDSFFEKKQTLKELGAWNLELLNLPSGLPHLISDVAQASSPASSGTVSVPDALTLYQIKVSELRPPLK